MSERTYARQTLWKNRTWRAFGLLNSWEIDPGPAGDWARRVQGICRMQLSYQLEARMRRVVEGVTP